MIVTVRAIRFVELLSKDSPFENDAIYQKWRDNVGNLYLNTAAADPKC
jgi:hypothetical protein